MKKLLILLLALVMCLTALTSCEQVLGMFWQPEAPQPEQPPVEDVEWNVEQAATVLKSLYKDDNPTTGADYTVVGQVMVKGVKYTVTWVSSSENVVVEPVEGSTDYNINVDEHATAEENYTLTATVTAGDGTTATVVLERVLPEENLFVSVGNPVEGTAYKFFMIQVSEGNKILYADGTTQSNQNKYLNTTQVGTDAPDFFVEKSGEGFKFYYMDGNDKTYIKAYLTTQDQVKFSKCLMYTKDTAEATVWVYDAATNSWKTDLVQNTLEGDKTVNYVIGTYGTYLTFSISESTYITPENTGKTQFPAGLIPKEIAEMDNSTPEEKIQATIDAIELPEIVSSDSVIALPNAGERYPDVTISWASNADFAVVGENGLTVTLQDAETTVTLTATLTFGEVTKTHEFTLALASSLIMNEGHPYGTYIYQAKLNGGTVLYLDGGVSGRYLTTTTDATKAVAVYAEKAEGGYKLYILVDGVKNYINIYTNSDNKTSVNYATETTTVYSYNKVVNAWTTVFGGNEVYLGTYNTYNTISVSNLSYITAENTGVDQFPLEILPVTPNGIVNMFVYQAKLNGGTVLYLDGGVSGRYLTTTDNAAAAVVVYAEKVEGGFKFYILVDGVKNYINVYNNDAGKSSVNYATETTTVYSYNPVVNAWVTVLGENEVYLGTYNTYNTISVSNLSYITAENTGVDQFPLDFKPATLAHEHVYEDVVVNPTCTENGSKTPTCACGDTLEAEVLPMAHTKDANGLCTVCNKWTFDSTLDHGAMDAETKANGDTAVFGAFTVHYKTSTKVDGSSKEFDDGFTGTHRLNIGGKTEVKDGLVCGAISFTVTEATTLKVWWVCGGDGRAIGLYTLGEDGKLVAPTTTYGTDSVKNTLYITEIEVPAAGTYYFGASGSNNYYKFELDAPEADTPVAEKVTASKTIAELITSEGWTDSTTKQEFKLDDKVTVKVDGGNNTGKAYNGDHIRIYATDSPAGTLTISVPEGYELVSVKISAVTGTYAFLYLGEGTTDICNTTVEVSGSSVVLNSVKNGSNGKQVRVTAIEVVYQAVTE